MQNNLRFSCSARSTYLLYVVLLVCCIAGEVSAVADVEVGPLLTTEWNQEAPYNAKCPVMIGVISGSHFTPSPSKAGCQAVAMAQIIAYHRYPQHGQGSHEYQMKLGLGVNGVPLKPVTISSNFSQHTYHWTDTANRLDVLDAATLIADCGIAVDTDYSNTGSLAEIIPWSDDPDKISRVSRALQDNFQYVSGSKLVLRRNMSDDQWFEKMRQEVDAGRPVLYSLQGQNDAHAVVLDGYRVINTDRLIHLNFGMKNTSLNTYYSIRPLA